MNNDTFSEHEARQQLTQLLADMRSPQEIDDFLSVFSNESDVQNLAKRIAILQLLEQDTSYEDIQTRLGVSSATVSAVAQIKELPISHRILERIEAHAWSQQIMKKIQNYLNPDLAKTPQ